MEGSGWERAEELEAALRRLMTAAAAFLDVVDQTYDLDDPQYPCQRMADALEDALAHALDDPQYPCQRMADALEDALAHARMVLPDDEQH